MEECLPIFSSHYSLTDSILTVDAPKKDKKTREYLKELPEDRPLSIYEIALVHKLDKVIICDSSLTGFWEIYKNGKDCDISPIFWWKTTVMNNHLDKSEEAALTESSIILGFKNSQAYYDSVKIVTEAQTNGFRNHPRISWDYLNERYSDNIEYVFPFYSNFISRNLMVYGANCIPKFGKINPIFLRQIQGLPYDNLLKESLENYCKVNKYPILDAHWIKYYKDADAESALVMKCIGSRSTLSKPEQKHFCSKSWSFESFLRINSSQIKIP